MPVTLTDWTVPEGRIEVAAALINPASANVLYRDDTPADPVRYSGRRRAGRWHPRNRAELLHHAHRQRRLSTNPAARQPRHRRHRQLLRNRRRRKRPAHPRAKRKRLRLLRRKRRPQSSPPTPNAYAGPTSQPPSTKSSATPAAQAHPSSSLSPARIPTSRRRSPSPPQPATVDGRSVTTINGTVSDAEDDDNAVTVTAATTLGHSQRRHQHGRSLGASR